MLYSNRLDTVRLIGKREEKHLSILNIVYKKREWKERIEIDSKRPLLGQLCHFGSKRPQNHDSNLKIHTVSHSERRRIESTVYAMKQYFMKNFFHAVGEVFNSYIYMTQSYGPMFGEMSSEVEIFRYKDYQII